MLSTKRKVQVFQTMSVRLKEGQNGPPDSYTDEEKAFYREMEKSTLEDEKAGRIANYDFPNDYDWEDDDFDYAACNR